MASIQQPKRGQKQNKQTREVSLRKVSDGLQQLSPNAVRLLREVYSIVDSDSTGAINRTELKQMVQSVGLASNDEIIDSMVARTGEPVTFAGFLAVMADQIGKLPERDDLDSFMDAFTKDGDNLDISAIRESLLSEGLSDKEVQEFIDGFSKRTAQGQQFDRKQFVAQMSI